MEEKQRIQAAKKAEQEAYDKRLNEEIANYNPFGRGGAGAPMKDTTGNVIGKFTLLFFPLLIEIYATYLVGFINTILRTFSNVVLCVCV